MSKNYYIPDRVSQEAKCSTCGVVIGRYTEGVNRNGDRTNLSKLPPRTNWDHISAPDGRAVPIFKCAACFGIEVADAEAARARKAALKKWPEAQERVQQENIEFLQQSLIDFSSDPMSDEDLNIAMDQGAQKHADADRRWEEQKSHIWPEELFEEENPYPENKK